MILEQDARNMLSERKIERDLTDGRSCAEIVEAMGLLCLETTSDSDLVATGHDMAKLQVENMTINVQPDRPPYFVR